MSDNQIGSILLFILAIPLGIYAVYSWKLAKERYRMMDKLLKDIGMYLVHRTASK